MKISYNWLKQFIQLEHKPEELGLILTDIGLEVESIEKVQSIPGGLEGLVIGKVITCEQHPNADRLRVTTVNVGDENDLKQIVCGAPNVQAGQTVVVATVGTFVHPLEGEPFKINKSKIRGEVSEGMICAEDEIGLGKSHDGIMVLPDEVPAGTLAKEYFNLEDDFVIEIGLTPNRADATSHWGVARDLAAYFKTKGVMPAKINEFLEGSKDPIPVILESSACKRYSSVLIEGVKVEESPEWLRNYLTCIGLRPINNVVDITNYVLHSLGQPLHAFDANKIAGNKVRVRQAQDQEVLITLDDVERKLSVEDLVICDENAPMCLAGVFGGQNSGVTEETQNVFLESAYFDAVSIRKSSKRYGLKTDASFRFERGTDPDMTLPALQYAAVLIQEIAGGKVTSKVSDIYPNPVKPFEFNVNLNRVRSLIGHNIDNEQIISIIKSLEIEVDNVDADEIAVKVPAYRVDVTREVDIVEEVLRIFGYNNIELTSQFKASINTSPKPNQEVVQNQIAELLVNNGYFETLTNSLTKTEYAGENESSVKVLNPLSSDLGIMRTSMVHSLLEVIEYNQKRKASNLKFFEFGKTYQVIEDKYTENNHLTLAVTGFEKSEHWSVKNENISFYHLKSAVDTILERLNIKDVEVEEANSPLLAYGITYTKNGQEVVSLGKVQDPLLKKMDVSDSVFVADFHWDRVLKLIKKNRVIFKEVSKFPSVKRDLALLINEDVKFKDLEKIAFRTERKLLKQINIFDVYKGDKLPEGKKSYALSFRLQDEEKTLSDKQIDAVINKLITNFEKEVGAEVRKQ